MKIRELLAPIIQKVNQKNARKFLPKTALALNIVDKFVFYERKLSWHYLKLLLAEENLNKDCTSETLQPFVTFLAKRWERIHHIYHLSYTYNYSEELTIVCYKLAVKLAEVYGNEIHALKFLMPSLQTYNENLMMDLVEIDAIASEDEKIQLHHFIVDHWGHIININDCIKYASFSKGDEAVLLHTSAQAKIEVEIDEKHPNANLPLVRALDHKDKIRVTYHSREAANLIKTMNHLIKEKDALYNAYDAIENLVGYLKMGGQRGGYDGTDAQSGEYSFIGIRKFYDFTKKLSPDDFSSLLGAAAIYNTHSFTFKTVWINLLTSAVGHPECNFSEEETIEILAFIMPYYGAEAKQEKKVREIMCAEQFALKLNEIKNMNPYLEDLKQIQSTAKNANVLQELDNSYKHALVTFEKAISKNQLTHFSPDDIPDEAVKAICDEIDLEDFCKRLASTNLDFAEALIILPFDLSNLHAIFIQNLGLRYLKTIIGSATQLIEVFQKLDCLDTHKKKPIQTLILTTLTKEYLSKIIITKKGTLSISKYLTTDLFLEYIPKKVPSPQVYNHSFLNKKWPTPEEKALDKSPKAHKHIRAMKH